MIKINLVNIGTNLKIIRKMKGFSQAELGKRIGVSGQMIQKYETGQSQVSSKILQLLAEHLAVDIRQFFDEGEGYLDLSEDGKTYEVGLDEGMKELMRAYAQLTTDDRKHLAAMAVVLANLKKDR
jgi:transcriptional regulator with XRE-family HTH domain